MDAFQETMAKFFGPLPIKSYDHLTPRTSEGFSIFGVRTVGDWRFATICYYDGAGRLRREVTTKNYPLKFTDAGHRVWPRSISYFDAQGNLKPPTRTELVCVRGATPHLLRHVGLHQGKTLSVCEPL